VRTLFSTLETLGTRVALVKAVKQLSKTSPALKVCLIVGDIVAVLLFSGLARADQGLLDGVVSIFGF
jgi:hypothetical protein